MKAAILGTGSWATSFGRHLCHKWERVVLWGIEPKQVQAINQTGTNPDFLGDIKLPPNLRATLDLDDAEVYVKLGCLEPEVRFSIVGDNTKMRLRIPQEAGLQISGLDFPVYLEEIGMIQDDSVWVTEGFEEAECKIMATAEDNFRSFSIDFY